MKKIRTFTVRFIQLWDPALYKKKEKEHFVSLEVFFLKKTKQKQNKKEKPTSASSSSNSK